jgi:beta-galactosidase
VRGDGVDLVYFVVSAVDAKGNFAPRANNLVHFTVHGPGEVVATDNGDPTDQNSFRSNKRHLFFGKAVTIIRSKSRIPGLITVTARASGLTQGTAAVFGTGGFPPHNQ